MSWLDVLFLALAVSGVLLLLCLIRLHATLPKRSTMLHPGRDLSSSHLLIVLGSGGHTAEMLNILRQYARLQLDWAQRTYVVSSGDDFSAFKAHEFEQAMARMCTSEVDERQSLNYDIITVHRARKVHQPLLTTPISSLRCLWDCINVLRGTHSSFRASYRPCHPDLILTNGPGTGVIVVLASLVLRFLGLHGANTPNVPKHAGTARPSTSPDSAAGQMRTIFIESWARVKTISLSGRLLRRLVNRFLVQWPQLATDELGGKQEFVGALVS